MSRLFHVLHLVLLLKLYQLPEQHMRSMFVALHHHGARRETIETYTNRLKQLEEITNQFKGVDKSFAIQAGREIRVMVVPEQVSDDDMVLMAREIAKQIEFELEYPGQIKVNVIRESRATDFAK